MSFTHCAFLLQVMPEQPGDVDRTCADIQKARDLLNYQPKVTFEEGIARTTAWYKEAFEEGFFNPSPPVPVTITTTTATTTNTSATKSNKEEFAMPKKPSKLHRGQSDLELSSFVQQAPKQLKRRTQAYISAEPVDSEPTSPKAPRLE